MVVGTQPERRRVGLDLPHHGAMGEGHALLEAGAAGGMLEQRDVILGRARLRDRDRSGREAIAEHHAQVRQSHAGSVEPAGGLRVGHEDGGGYVTSQRVQLCGLVGGIELEAGNGQQRGDVPAQHRPEQRAVEVG